MNSVFVFYNFKFKKKIFAQCQIESKASYSDNIYIVKIIIYLMYETSNYKNLSSYNYYKPLLPSTPTTRVFIHT